ncbi:MAG: hypothetical protein R3A10_01800 [Caldilineaceae bacterium]
MRPIPYYIFAFALLLIFAPASCASPVSGGTTFGRQAEYELVVHQGRQHSFLPALSIFILNAVVWFQTMKLDRAEGQRGATCSTPNSAACARARWSGAT